MKDVLVVEDDQKTRDALMKFLIREGYATRGARTAQIAVSEIRQQSPDILISDWDLGGDTTGVHVVAFAIRCNPRIQAVMVSGNNLARLRYETRELPIHGYISKPYTLSDLRAVLGELA